MSDIVEKIKAAFERDQARRGQPRTSARELPLDYESITDAWLTDALCGKTSGAMVTGHRLGPVDSGSSNRRRLMIDYNDAGRRAKLPTALFCKAAHSISNRIVLGVSQASTIETTFYRDLRPLLDIEAPVCFFAHFDPETYNYLVMLADITDSVTEFCSHKTQMPRARAESEMRLLGRMHGICYSNPAAKPVLKKIGTWPEYFTRTLAFGMEAGSNKGFRDAESVIPPKIFARYDDIWPLTLASVERHKHLPRTLAHGDVHLKNWYVAGNGEMGLSDWQCASEGHFSRDVCYALATALTTENRRAWERDLVRLHLEEMRAAGGPAVSFDEAWLNYRQQLMTALTWWTITLAPTADLPDMQPRDITLEFIRRIAQAMEDVDTLGSFKH